MLDKSDIAKIMCLTTPFLGNSEEVHSFKGHHFLGSYLECDSENIRDPMGILMAMDQAIQACGATIVDKSYFVFPGNGITVVYMLSESHASIHTYPEVNSCFVDLFTCGDHCSSEKFDKKMRAYLLPKDVNVQEFVRN